MSWSGTKSDFANQYGPLIKSLASGTGIFPEIAMGQAFIEGSDANGNMGKGTAMVNGNNVYNIRVSPGWTGASTNADGILQTDYELNPLNVVPFMPTWRAYDSIEDSIKDYFKFLQENDNYKNAGVFTASTPEAQAAALQKAGYAGAATNYASVLSSVAASAKKLMGDVVQDAEDYSDYFIGLGLLVAGGYVAKKQGWIKL